MEIEFHRHQGVSLIVLPRRLVMANAAGLRDGVNSHIENTCSRIVLDLGRVEFMDSSGLSVLVSALKKTHARGGKIVLLNPSEQIKALMMLTRMHEVFTIHANSEVALMAVSQAADSAV